MEKSIKNIDDLISDLQGLYEEARNGSIKLKDAREVANVAGKLIKASSLKFEYNKFLDKDGIVKFLES